MLSHANKRLAETDVSASDADSIKKKAEKTSEQLEFERKTSAVKDIFLQIGLTPSPDYLANEIAKNNNIYQFASTYFCNEFFSGCTYDEIQLFIEQLLSMKQALTLVDAIKLCPASSATTFYTKVNLRINTRAEFEDIVDGIPNPANKVNFICEFHLMLTARDGFPISLINKLPDEYRYDAAYALRSMIHNTNELAAILRLLPEECKFDLAIEMSPFLRENISDIVSITRELPTVVKTSFAYMLREQIRGVSALNLINSALPADEIVDFTASLIVTSRNLTDIIFRLHLISAFSTDDESELMKAISAKIKTAQHLVNYLLTLDDEDRFDAATPFLGVINNGYDLAIVGKILLPDGRLKLINELKAKIADCDQLAAILATLRFHEAHDLVIALKAEFIRNDKDLAGILKKFPLHLCYAIAHAYVKVIKSYEQAASILTILPINRRANFLRLAQGCHSESPPSANQNFMFQHLLYELISTGQIDINAMQIIDKMLAGENYPENEVIEIIKKSGSTAGYERVTDKIFGNIKIDRYSNDLLYNRLPYLCYLLDLKLVKIEDLPTLTTQLEHVERINLENILESPTKFGKTALKTILDCGFTLSVLIKCTHPWTLHRLLEKADNVKTMFNAAASPKEILIAGILSATEEEFHQILANGGDMSAQITPLKTKITNGSQLARELTRLRDIKRPTVAWELRETIQNGDQLHEIMNLLPDLARPVLACALTSKHQNFEQAFKNMCLLPANARRDFIIQLKRFIASTDQYLNVLSKLLDNDKIIFIRDVKHQLVEADLHFQILKNCTSMVSNQVAPEFRAHIHNCGHLSIMLDLMPANDRLQLAVQFRALITDNNYLAAIVTRLPKENRIEFINTIWNSTLPTLPADRQSHIAKYYLYRISSDSTPNPTEYLTALQIIQQGVEAIPAPDQIAIIRQYVRNVDTDGLLPAFVINNNYLNLHAEIPKRLLLQLFYLLDNKIVTAEDFNYTKALETNEVVNLLNMLESPTKFSPQALKLLVDSGFTVKQLLGCTHTWTLHRLLEHAPNVVAYLNSINNNELKLELVREFLSSPEQVLLTTLSIHQDRAKFIRETQIALHHGRQMTHQLANILMSYRMEIALSCKNLIKDASQLAHVLALLPETSRLGFANELKLLMITGNDVALVSKLLPEDVRLAFVREFKTIINNTDSIRTNIDSIRAIYSILPGRDPAYIMSLLREFVKSGTELAGMLDLLPEESRLDIVCGLRFLIDTTEDLAAVVSALPRRERIPFLERTVISRDQITENTANSHLLRLLLSWIERFSVPSEQMIMTLQLLMSSGVNSMPVARQINFIKRFKDELTPAEVILPNFIVAQGTSVAAMNVMKEFILQLYFLLDHKIICRDDFNCLKSNLQNNERYNLENLLASPTKFSPDSLKTLLSCGFSFSQLLSCKHTWTLHHMLENADKMNTLITQGLQSAPSDSSARARVLTELMTMEPDILRKLSAIKPSKRPQPSSTSENSTDQARGRGWGLLSWFSNKSSANPKPEKISSLNLS